MKFEEQNATEQVEETKREASRWKNYIPLELRRPADEFVDLSFLSSLEK